MSVPHDAIALLRSDHRAVASLFAQFATAGSPSHRQALATSICQTLLIHLRIEEDMFYPACQGKVAAAMLTSSCAEHNALKTLITQIAAVGEADCFHDAKLKLLAMEISHHNAIEEQPHSGLFAQVRQSGLDLVGLGIQMAAEQARLQALFKPASARGSTAAIGVAIGQAAHPRAATVVL